MCYFTLREAVSMTQKGGKWMDNPFSYFIKGMDSIYQIYIEKKKQQQQQQQWEMPLAGLNDYLRTLYSSKYPVFPRVLYTLKELSRIT